MASLELVPLQAVSMASLPQPRGQEDALDCVAYRFSLFPHRDASALRLHRLLTVASGVVLDDLRLLGVRLSFRPALPAPPPLDS